jgi:hypothetical protein
MPATISKPLETYFRFEKDFVENGIRCIPMIVRFKLDAVGIKLKLREWAKFNSRERKYLSVKSCDSAIEIYNYRLYLQQLVRRHTGTEATELPVDKNPSWQLSTQVNEELLAHAELYGWTISAGQWQALSDLQRFALLKLCREGHENKNFPLAMHEFKLVNS